MQGFCDSLGVVHQGIDDFLREIVRRIGCAAVSGMNACALKVLHDSRNQNVFSVCDTVYIHFLALDVLVDQDRMLVGHADGFLQVGVQLIVVVYNLHCAAADNEGRADNQRISEFFHCGFSLFMGADCAALRGYDVQLVHQFVEFLTVLGQVDILILGSQNVDSAGGQSGRQVQGGLSSELQDDAFRTLLLDDVHDVVRVQRVKIQLVRGIKVCADGLWVVVDDN